MTPSAAFSTMVVVVLVESITVALVASMRGRKIARQGAGVDHELGHVGTRQIRRELGHDRARVIQGRRAARRRREQRPTVAQGIAVDVARAAAVEAHHLADADCLVRPRLRGGRGCVGRDLVGLGCVRRRAVGSIELHDVDAGHIDEQARPVG